MNRRGTGCTHEAIFACLKIAGARRVPFTLDQVCRWLFFGPGRPQQRQRVRRLLRQYTAAGMLRHTWSGYRAATPNAEQEPLCSLLEAQRERDRLRYNKGTDFFAGIL